MLHIRFLIMLITTCFTMDAIAQYDPVTTDSFGTVVVKKNPRLILLSEKQVEINKRAAILSGGIRRSGYRIQVINTQNRGEANEVKSEMLRRFPDQKAYLVYKAPSYRVRVGNFVTQKDAEQMRKMLSALYPERGIYVVQDIIDQKVSFDEGVEDY